MNRAGLDFARFLYARVRNLKSLTLNIISNPVVVLCYHRVARMKSDLNALAVTPDNFRSHLEYLKRTFPIVRFEQEWPTVNRPSVAITFDDGYADNLEVALPIIEEAGVPVTFFVSTAAIDSGDEFWWDALERLVLGDSGYPGEFTAHDPRGKTTWPSATLAERKALFREVHSLLLDASAEQRLDWLRQIRAWAGEG
ncbi:MAG: polysaccharide deacetylase family protein, partial [Pseudomonadota bacterium]